MVGAPPPPPEGQPPMMIRVAAALTVAAVIGRVRAVTGPHTATDSPSRPVRRPGRHRRPSAPTRAAMTVRSASGRARRAIPRPPGARDAGGRHRKRRASPR